MARSQDANLLPVDSARESLLGREPARFPADDEQ
jgi:hypothetical protein